MRRHNSPCFRMRRRHMARYRAAEPYEEDEAAAEQLPQHARALEKGGSSGSSASVADATTLSVGLRCMAAAPDGRVFVGFQSGHLKCFTPLGRFLFKKVLLPARASGFVDAPNPFSPR